MVEQSRSFLQISSKSSPTGPRSSSITSGGVDFFLDVSVALDTVRVGWSAGGSKVWTRRGVQGGGGGVRGT